MNRLLAKPRKESAPMCEREPRLCTAREVGLHLIILYQGLEEPSHPSWEQGIYPLCRGEMRVAMCKMIVIEMKHCGRVPLGFLGRESLGTYGY